MIAMSAISTLLRCYMAGRSCATRRCATLRSANGIAATRRAGGVELSKSSEEHACHSRTQWDAMTEATSAGKFRATRLALLISVRYGPRTGAGTWAIYKLAELSQHR